VPRASECNDAATDTGLSRIATEHLLNLFEAKPDLSHGCLQNWFGSHVALRFLMASGAIPAFFGHGNKSVKTLVGVRVAPLCTQRSLRRRYQEGARAEGSNSGVLSYSRHLDVAVAADSADDLIFLARENPMADTDIMVVAATLASGLLVGGTVKPESGTKATPAPFAAMVYFDCLEAIHAERSKRHQEKIKSLKT
jgi:hypothetical protein